MKKLVIVPVYNEEENIQGVIKELREDLPEVDILVVNDASRDNTLNILQELNIDVITTPYNLGYAGVVQTGFKYAAQKGYNYVAQFDGDGQHIAKELKKLYEYSQRTNADIVIGSRFKEETNYRHAFFRKIGTTFFQKLIMLVTKQKITDPTSGMQVLSYEVYSKYAQMNNYPEYPDANLLMEMILQGYKVKELGVKMRERTAGISMHAGVWKPCKYMIKMIYSLLIIILTYRSVKRYKKEGRAIDN